MYNIISPVQTIKELQFIRQQSGETHILPLDLATLIYCIEFEESFISPQAYSDNTPILILPGGEDTHQSGISPVFSPSENYRNITKWSIQANHVERIPNLLRKAFYELKTGKGSPVLVEIPVNILETEYADKINYVPPQGNKISPDSDEVREVAKFLISSKNPVIHAGQGCLYAEAWTELQDIATLLDAPVMTTNTGKSAFPENHPLSLGAAGRSVTGHGFKFMQESDVIFGIGCSFTKTFYNPQIPENKKIQTNNKQNC